MCRAPAASRTRSSSFGFPATVTTVFALISLLGCRDWNHTQGKSGPDALTVPSCTPLSRAVHRHAVHVPFSPAYHHGRQAVAPRVSASDLPSPSPGHAADPSTYLGTPTPSPLSPPISPARPGNATLPGRVLIQSPIVPNSPRRDVPDAPRLSSTTFYPPSLRDEG
jgi:hypothetical protein